MFELVVQRKKTRKNCCPQQVVFPKPADYSKLADYSKAVVYKCKLVDYSKAVVYKCKVASVNWQFTLVKYLIPGLQLFFL